MKKTTKILLTVSLMAVPAIVLAQAPVQAVPAKNVVACEKIAEKVSARISKLSDFGATHDNKSSQVISRLTEISSKLKARGVDTTSLDSQIVALQGKKVKLDASKQEMLTKLEESKTLTCGASSGQFKLKVAEARTLQKAVVINVKDFHDTTKSVRDTIKSLRAQVASSTPKTV